MGLAFALKLEEEHFEDKTSSNDLVHPEEVTARFIVGKYSREVLPRRFAQHSGLLPAAPGGSKAYQVNACSTSHDELGITFVTSPLTPCRDSGLLQTIAPPAS